MSTRLLPALACAAIVIPLSACSLHQEDWTATPPELSRQWANATVNEGGMVDRQWWKKFGSAQLPALIEELERNAPDMKIAAQRVRQAELRMQLAGASLFPAVDLRGTGSWRRNDDPGQSAVDRDSAELGVGIRYELDLWGRLAAQRESAREQYLASELDHQALRITLMAGVAEGYFQWLATSERLDLARRNLELAEQILTIVESRHRHGSVSELDVSRQRGLVLGQQAALIPLEARKRESLAALAILLGQTPESFQPQPEQFTALHAPELSPSLPADLLVRRPDLAASERRLAAANADVQAARAALLPSIDLSGGASLSTAGLRLMDPGYGLSLAASLSQSLFDGGQRKARQALEESRREELIESYRRDILVALREVEDSAIALERGKAAWQAETRIRDESQRALELAERRYQEGAEDLQAVLEAQRSLFQSEDRITQARLETLRATLGMFKALGGDWHARDTTLEALDGRLEKHTSVVF